MLPIVAENEMTGYCLEIEQRHGLDSHMNKQSSEEFPNTPAHAH